ncbi:MAG: sigma-70 family RNA polymerase sigma factor [Spirochaetes bacterium]|nr:sigma-70 family RNA polymerase sigma factor [Spirochaetota bacterium]
MSEIQTADAGFDKEFSENYRRYAAPVIRFIKKMVYDRDISEELCQDVFLKVYEKRISLDPESPRTLGFFFTAARNIAIDYVRKKRSEEEKLQALRVEEVVMDRQFYEDIENVCLRGEVISTLGDVISGFPEERRALIAATCLGGRSAASVARESGMSAYRVRKIGEEACRAIRTRMEGFFEDDSGKTGLTEKNTLDNVDRALVRKYIGGRKSASAPAARKRVTGKRSVRKRAARVTAPPGRKRKKRAL